MKTETRRPALPIKNLRFAGLYTWIRQVFAANSKRGGLGYKCELSCQLAQKLTFVHAVFEGFVAIDEDDRNFVGELTAQLVIRIDINFMPGEPAPPMQFGQGLFDDLAKMTTLSRINYYLAQDGHEAKFSNCRMVLPAPFGKDR
jgi:hypothetical protein